MDIKRLLKMWITGYISAGLHASPKSTTSRRPHKIRGNSVFVQCSQLQKAKSALPRMERPHLSEVTNGSWRVVHCSQLQ
jgi:hypothetical protein